MTDERQPARATVAAAWATAGVFAVLALEVFSFVALSTMRHQWFTYARMQSARAAVAGSQEQPARTDATGPEPPVFMATEVIHPFLGLVLDRSFSRCSPDLAGYRDALDYGFACSEAPLVQRRSRDSVVVAVLGGSVAATFPAYGTRALVEELRRAPGFAGKRILLASLALPGYKQPQQLMTLSYFLTLGAEFDIVVNLDGFNDVVLPAVENVPKGVFPFFPRSWFFRAGTFDPATRREIGEATYIGNRRAERALLFSEAPWRYSASASLLWAILDRLDATRIARVQAKLLQASSRQDSYVVTGPTRHYDDEEAMYRDLASVWQRSSLQMHQLAEANGARYFHFLQPNQYVAGSKRFGEQERRVALQDSVGYRHSVVAAYPLLRDKGLELGRSGVHFHDMTQVFAEESQALYVDDCCHYNPKGYELLAHAMGRAIADDLRAPLPSAQPVKP